MPPPYRAWLAMSNDPDNTRPADWRELNDFIWGQLGLPFGDALFVRSFNCNLPGQVNLHDHPEIAAAHAHDTLHGWGDYVHARSRGFDREDAVEAIALLDKHGLRPRVWVDHSTHPQNMLHNSTAGSTPQQVDGSGHVYRSFTYTLDLAAQLGIRFFWDGKLSAILGQDIDLSPWQWFRHRASSRFAAALLCAWHWLASRRLVTWRPALVRYDARGNRQYYAHEFADGQVLYCFRRFGTWADADIDGLGRVIAPRNIDELIRREATCIVYTHLGKRRASRLTAETHIPADTRTALGSLRAQYDRQLLKLSPVSTMLDYLVLRDHIVVAADGGCVDFRADGIRFARLGPEDLAGHVFGVRAADAVAARGLSIRISGEPVDAEVRRHEGNDYSIDFSGVGPG